MDFGTNKAPIEVIKKREFGETHSKNIYSGVNGKRYRNS